MVILAAVSQARCVGQWVAFYEKVIGSNPWVRRVISSSEALSPQMLLGLPEPAFSKLLTKKKTLLKLMWYHRVVPD